MYFYLLCRSHPHSQVRMTLWVTFTQAVQNVLKSVLSFETLNFLCVGNFKGIFRVPNNDNGPAQLKIKFTKGQNKKKFMVIERLKYCNNNVYCYHFVGHCDAFCGLKWRIWQAKMHFSPLK